MEILYVINDLDIGFKYECTAEQWCKCQDSRNNTYTCVVDIAEEQTFKFCRFQDFFEAYDLNEDPFELENIYSTMKAGTISDYEKMLDTFKDCLGTGCDI
ncbi:hypothetical protein NQ318_005701 [Aromia moschata]|uniref:Uncharacterized protein n=1 Tax=Aromia moschata TaxID=1265417 RepID=A0AAV8XKL8_9CUCU|nr:hypothetical protein NQ318_005701 [Aromia moschata]